MMLAVLASYSISALVLLFFNLNFSLKDSYAASNTFALDNSQEVVQRLNCWISDVLMNRSILVEDERLAKLLNMMI